MRYKVDGSPGEPPGRGQVDPDSGKKIFTPDQKATINKSFVNAKFLSDVLPMEEMYRTVESSSRCKHLLMCNYSNHGESRLESFHQVEAHMANSGMRASLADILSLRGTARFNVRIRERIRIDSLPRDIKERVPSWLRGIPAFYDHSLLEVLNKQAAAVGASCPFPFVRPTPRENNGELFLSEYFHAQVRRNRELTPSLFNNRCQCSSCEGNPIPLPHEIESAAAAAATGSGSDGGVASVGANKSLEAIVPEGYMKNPYGRNGKLVYIGGKGPTSKKSRIEVTVKKVVATIEEDNDTGSKEVSNASVLHEATATVLTPLPARIHPELTPILPIGHPSQSIPFPPSHVMQQAPYLAPFQFAMVIPPLLMPYHHSYAWPPTSTFFVPPNNPQKRKRVLQGKPCCVSFAWWAIHRRKGRPIHDKDCSHKKKLHL